MSVQNDSNEIAECIRTMRVFTGVLLAGLVMFLLVVVMVQRGQEPKNGGQPDIATLILLGQAGLALLAGLLLPGRILARRLRELAQSRASQQISGEVPTAALLNELRGTSIFRLALLEGACFTVLLATLISGNLWLVAFVGVVLVLMMREWPTVESVTGWVLEQRDRIRQEF